MTRPIEFQLATSDLHHPFSQFETTTAMVSRVLLLCLVTVFGLSVGQDGDHTNHFSQIISGVGEKLKTAGYQEHELTEKVLNIKPNDTTFYHR